MLSDLILGCLFDHFDYFDHFDHFDWYFDVFHFAGFHRFSLAFSSDLLDPGRDRPDPPDPGRGRGPAARRGRHGRHGRHGPFLCGRGPSPSWRDR